MKICCKKCKHHFFEAEKDYICCSNCGEIVKENFPEDPVERGPAYFQAISYNKYIKTYHRFLFIAFYILIPLFNMIYLFFTSGFSNQEMRVLRKDVFFLYVVMFLLGTLLISPFVFENGRIYREILGDDFFWNYTSNFSFKIVKWILFAVFIYFFMKYITGPLVLERYNSKVGTEIGLRNLEKIRLLYYVNTVGTCGLNIFIDILEQFRHHLARRLDKKRFAQVRKK